MRYWPLVLSAVIFLLAIIYFMCSLPFNDGSGVRNHDVFADFGTFINGLFGTIISLLSCILIYITFDSQRRSSRDDEQRQRIFFQTERFESRFFEMIKSNREMVFQMEYEIPDEYTPVDSQLKKHNGNKHHFIVVRGQKVFVQMYKQIRQALEECNWLLNEYKDTSSLFKNEEVENKELNLLSTYYEAKNESLFFRIHWINIVYLCVFFGLSEDGQKSLNRILKEKYNPELVDKIISTLKIKPVKWSDFWGSYCKQKEQSFVSLKNGHIPFEGRKYEKYYGGHIHRLGHYFRNTFTIYNFINTRNFLNFQQKYSYAKQFRSQFSTYEHALFFYNSLSSLGRIWDIDANKNEEKSDEQEINLPNKQLITKYNLVKNLPSEFVLDLPISNYYPLVEFELGNMIEKKNELKKQYS